MLINIVKLPEVNARKTSRRGAALINITEYNGRRITLLQSVSCPLLFSANLGGCCSGADTRSTLDP